MSKEKGIIYCPHFEESNGDVYIPHVQIRDAQMQFFCLYWDYIVQPVSTQLPRWKKSTNENVLEDAGILITDYQEVADDAQELFVREQAYSIKSEGAHEWVPKFLEFQYKSLEKIRNEKPNVIWTPQQSLREIDSAPKRSSDVHCVQLQLHNKLPVPSGDASIKKIVTFKHENLDLFNEFKLSIDRLTHFVSQAGSENEYSINLAIDDLEKATKEIEKASKQRFGKLVIFENVRLNIGSAKLSSLLGDFFKGGVLSGGASSDIFMAFLGGLANAAANFVTVEPKEAKRLHCIPEEQIELGYLTRGYSEGIFKGM